MGLVVGVEVSGESAGTAVSQEHFHLGEGP